MITSVEQTRLTVSRGLDADTKSALGQYFTPEKTARFMASLFPQASGDARLLDAGAGIGSLSAAFLERWRSGGLVLSSVTLDAFELDRGLHPHLARTLDRFQDGGRLRVNVRHEDYVLTASRALSSSLFYGQQTRYTHAILNPPYKKIHSASAHRAALRTVGVETANLYSGFVALAVLQCVRGAQVVAILPRSFCNGSYFRPFREFILERASIRHLHLFRSRTEAFKDDDVLQENVILRLEVGGQPAVTTVSTSTDGDFTDLTHFDCPWEQIVVPGDPERLIHVPSSPASAAPIQMPGAHFSLAELGLKVSTGPVVDFRLREHLRSSPEHGAVPLVYPAHLSMTGPTWPLEGFKKPNAILHNSATERWLYPNGFYCAVRRLSSKEERRRVVASLVDPSAFGAYTMVGFENHINLFHEDRHGLPEPLARGLMVWLNSTVVDEAFRRFSGNTQVNATDLRQLKYPSRDGLVKLGTWARCHQELSQAEIDEHVMGLTA